MDIGRIIVCRECSILLRQTVRAPSARWRPALLATQQTNAARRSFSSIDTSPPRHCNTSLTRPDTQPTRQLRIRARTSLPPARRQQHQQHLSPQDLNALHTRITTLSAAGTSSEDGHLPSEQTVLHLLDAYISIAHSLLDAKTANALRTANAARDSDREDGNMNGQTTSTATSTSALLGSVHARSYPAFLSKASVLNLISTEAEAVLRHSDVFITPTILKRYVELQTSLHQPDSLPDIFHLYANKPIPTLSSSTKTPTYAPANPSQINAAIDSKTANLALTSALEAHDLSLAIDIIQTTFCTRAFHRSKIFRQALIPFSGLAIFPLAAYTLSTQFAALQNTMSPQFATGVAFAGICAYVAHVGTIGFVVVTTANDQMDRVTWAQGLPLWERWVREEERAAVDRVAGRWGFQSVERRGEEEGEDWDRLKEFVGMKGMMLDRVELMDGME